MIVYDFYIERIALFPPEAKPPALINSNAVLPLAITLQSFEVIVRRDS
jgi:hypothetical protein